MKQMTIQLHPDADLQVLQSGATTLRAHIRVPGAVIDYEHMLRDPAKVYLVPMAVEKSATSSIITLHELADIVTSDSKQTIMAEIRQKVDGSDVISFVPMELC